MRIRIKLITIQVEKGQVLVPSLANEISSFSNRVINVQSEMINYKRISNKVLQIKEIANFLIIIFLEMYKINILYIF